MWDGGANSSRWRRERREQGIYLPSGSGGWGQLSFTWTGSATPPDKTVQHAQMRPSREGGAEARWWGRASPTPRTATGSSLPPSLLPFLIHNHRKEQPRLERRGRRGCARKGEPSSSCPSCHCSLCPQTRGNRQRERERESYSQWASFPGGRPTIASSPTVAAAISQHRKRLHVAAPFPCRPRAELPPPPLSPVSVWAYAAATEAATSAHKKKSVVAVLINRPAQVGSSKIRPQRTPRTCKTRGAACGTVRYPIAPSTGRLSI